MGREEISDYIDYLAFVNQRRESIIRTLILDILADNGPEILRGNDDA